VATLLNLNRPQALLAAWYGEPLASGDAGCLYEETEGELRSRLCTGQPVAQLQVLQLLCRYWMGSPIELDYTQLCASLGEGRERALLELIYGQLLMSRKLRPALQHLDHGFRLAVDYLAAADYFLLVRRHELLRHVPLSGALSEPRGLRSLLAEAAVVRQLQGSGRHARSVLHLDTLG